MGQTLEAPEFLLFCPWDPEVCGSMKLRRSVIALVAHQWGEMRRRGQYSWCDIHWDMSDRSPPTKLPISKAEMSTSRDWPKAHQTGLAKCEQVDPFSVPHSWAYQLSHAEDCRYNHPTLSMHMCMLHTFTPPPPSHFTLLFVISCKRANIFPVFARLDPHLIKLAHYVALWLVEGNQLFNSQTRATGAGGAQRAAHLIPRTLISYKAKQELSFSHPTKLPHLVLWASRTLGAWRRKEVWVRGIEDERNKKKKRRRGEDRCIGSIYALFRKIPVSFVGS